MKKSELRKIQIEKLKCFAKTKDKKLEDTILIVIRHNKAVNKKLIVMLPDKTYYDIASISPDDSNNVITYDIVTLKLNTSIKQETTNATITTLAKVVKQK